MRRSYVMFALALLVSSVGVAVTRTSESGGPLDPGTRLDVNEIHAKADWRELRVADVYDAF